MKNEKLFERQLEIRKIIHAACAILDKGESMLCMDPKRELTKSEWLKLDSTLNVAKTLTGQVSRALVGSTLSRANEEI